MHRVGWCVEAVLEGESCAGEPPHLVILHITLQRLAHQRQPADVCHAQEGQAVGEHGKDERRWATAPLRKALKLEWNVLIDGLVVQELSLRLFHRGLGRRIAPVPLV